MVTPTAVLMMNHSNLLDLKQNEAVTFRGVVPLGFRRKSGVFSVCCLALVAVLLASESLPVSLATLFPVFLSFSTLPILHGHCTGLPVCVHVCACIYVYREIYM